MNYPLCFFPLHRFQGELDHARGTATAPLHDGHEQNQCPANDRLCLEAVWFIQTMLLGPRTDMEQIAEAIRKIQAQAGRLVKV